MYEYLKYRNKFQKTNEIDLEKIEQEFSFRFPDPLREFYLEVGWGEIIYKNPVFKEQAYWSGTNIFLPPQSVLCFMSGQLFDNDVFYMDETFYERLEPGEIPFYEVGDSTYFMVLKNNHDKNYGCVDYLGDIVAKSFEEFVYKLYYEGPEFYKKYVILEENE